MRLSHYLWPHQSLFSCPKSEGRNQDEESAWKSSCISSSIRVKLLLMTLWNNSTKHYFGENLLPIMPLALTHSLPNSLGKLQQCHQPLVSIVSRRNTKTYSPLRWCFGQNFTLRRCQCPQAAGAVDNSVQHHEGYCCILLAQRSLSRSGCTQATIQLYCPAKLWRPQSRSSLSLGAANRTSSGTGAVVTKSPWQHTCILYSFLVLGQPGLSCHCCCDLLQCSTLDTVCHSTLSFAMD